MNLVPQNVNEAIKHLKPRSEEEIQAAYQKDIDKVKKILNMFLEKAGLRVISHTLGRRYKGLSLMNPDLISALGEIIPYYVYDKYSNLKKFWFEHHEHWSSEVVVLRDKNDDIYIAAIKDLEDETFLEAPNIIKLDLNPKTISIK